jgi:FkbM family methyltransferase
MRRFWLRLLSTLFTRRFCRGSAEFRFRPLVGTREEHRIGVASRANGFRTTVYLRRGTTDAPVFGQIFFDLDYDTRPLARGQDILAAYEGIVAGGATPLILDLGANIGLTSLYFTKNWPRARILAVEPQEDNFRILLRNVNGHANIQPLKAAVAGEDGFVSIAEPHAEAWAYRTLRSAEGSGAAIPALSVKSLMARGDPGPKYIPFIAKIDIEGYEADLFSKNKEWIELFPLVVVELHDWLLPMQRTAGSFLRAIAPLDRNFVYIDQNIFSISNRLQESTPNDRK